MEEHKEVSELQQRAAQAFSDAMMEQIMTTEEGLIIWMWAYPDRGHPLKDGNPWYNEGAD